METLTLVTANDLFNEFLFEVEGCVQPVINKCLF